MLYDMGFTIFSLFYLPTLIFKGKLHKDFGERFGAFSAAKRRALERGRDAIWIQAVSVGEVALCRSLIPALKDRFPASSIVFSTITRAGNELAVKLFSKDATVIYFPLDLSFIVKKVSALIRPRVYVMVETEIWPNLIKALSGRPGGTSMVIINGRISDRSFGKYHMARGFLRSALDRIGAFCMQSDVDAGRIVAIGASKDKVRVTGNMKFDADTASVGSGDSIRSMLGLRPEEELFVAGSTHKGEEAAVLSVFKRLSQEFPGMRLLIAPRHIERSKEVEHAIRGAGFQPLRVSQAQAREDRSARHVFVLDTIGQLNGVFSIASLVFVGGSLVRHGGQNPLEPASFGKPILFGPHMFNFRGIADTLLKNDAAVQVGNAGELFRESAALLRDRNRARDIGWNAKRTLNANRGATLRNVEAIMKASR